MIKQSITNNIKISRKKFGNYKKELLLFSVITSKIKC
jgi:predicted DNA-binding protein YlxM (UPF0122 family)